MQFKKKSSLRLIRAFFNTLEGLRALWVKEAAFRQEIYCIIFLIPLVVLLHISLEFKLLLVLLMLLLLAVEAINSGFEAVIDRISLDIHPQSKLVKDIGSAAVGIVVLMNIIGWSVATYLHFQ